MLCFHVKLMLRQLKFNTYHTPHLPRRSKKVRIPCPAHKGVVRMSISCTKPSFSDGNRTEAHIFAFRAFARCWYHVSRECRPHCIAGLLQITTNMLPNTCLQHVVLALRRTSISVAHVLFPALDLHTIPFMAWEHHPITEKRSLSRLTSCVIKQNYNQES